MRINVLVSPSETIPFEFAKVEIQRLGGGIPALLDIDFSKIRGHCRESSTLTLDFLFLASIVYAVDKLIPRSNAPDHWTRDLELNLPLVNLNLYSPQKRNIELALSFLTGDNWRINSSQLQHNLIRLRRRKRWRLFNDLMF